MVSTRQMSNVGAQGSSSDDAGPSRPTRHNSVITTNAKIVYPTPVASVVENPESALVLRTPSKKNINLLNMPPEVMEKIFSYIGYKEIGQLRIICRQMNYVCGHILNSAFHKLQTQMLHRFQNIKAKMPRRESARRSHQLASECDIVETLHMRLNLLHLTFGKHIERRHCCFFPGEILDEVNRVMRYLTRTIVLDKPFKVTDELFDLSTMAMEYFKEKLEPTLPEIGRYIRTNLIGFSASGASKSYLCLENSSTTKDIMDNLDSESPPLSPDDRILESPVPPQSNMVLRKRIRKIKQGMKRYNNQLTAIRTELRTYKRRTVDQQKIISEQQKLIAEIQKQSLDYASRFDENDKKNDEMSRKFQTMLQELNKCKTEVQYWRSKSPATPVCNGCGNVVVPVPQEDLEVLMNQGVKPEDIGVVLPTGPSEFMPISNNLEESLDTELCDQTRELDVVESFSDLFKAHNSTSNIGDLKELKVVSPKLNIATKRILEEPTTPSTVEFELESPPKKPRRILKRCGKLRNKP